MNNLYAPFKCFLFFIFSVIVGNIVAQDTNCIVQDTLRKHNDTATQETNDTDDLVNTSGTKKKKKNNLNLGACIAGVGGVALAGLVYSSLPKQSSEKNESGIEKINSSVDEVKDNTPTQVEDVACDPCNELDDANDSDNFDSEIKKKFIDLLNELQNENIIKFQNIWCKHSDKVKKRILEFDCEQKELVNVFEVNLSECENCHFNLLHCAAYNMNLKFIAFLMANGAKINANYIWDDNALILYGTSPIEIIKFRYSRIDNTPRNYFRYLKTISFLSLLGACNLNGDKDSDSSSTTTECQDVNDNWDDNYNDNNNYDEATVSIAPSIPEKSAEMFSVEMFIEKLIRENNQCQIVTLEIPSGALEHIGLNPTKYSLPENFQIKKDEVDAYSFIWSGKDRGFGGNIVHYLLFKYLLDSVIEQNKFDEIMRNKLISFVEGIRDFVTMNFGMIYNTESIDQVCDIIVKIFLNMKDNSGHRPLTYIKGLMVGRDFSKTEEWMIANGALEDNEVVLFTEKELEVLC